MSALPFAFTFAQIAVGRFEPAERGSSFFVADDLAFGSAAAGATLAYGYKPLVVEDATGAERAAPVRHQAVVHAGGSFVVARRLRVGLDVPFAAHQDGEPSFVDGAPRAAATKPAFGDVRLAADVRLLHVLAAGVRVWLPTGAQSQWMGEGVVRIGPQLLTGGSAGPFVWGTRAAYVLRDTNEFVFAGAAGVRIDAARLVVGPEAWMSTADRTPLEWLFGVRHDLGAGFRVAAGAGGGLTNGIGAPRFRGVVTVEWVLPEAKPADVPPEPPPEDPWRGYEPPPPLVHVTETEIAIREQIPFAIDSADLVGDGGAVLPDVLNVLETHAEIAKVRVEGHTDATGDAAHNEDLSKRRAETVVKWLVDRGIDPARLEAAGYGSSRPIAPNDTEEGRAKNRRVVFVIVERR